MATKQEMYNRYNKPGRKVSWERVAQGVGTGAIEGGTIGSAFGPKGTAIGAGVGAIAGGTIGALSSPKQIDPVLYQEMIDRYSKGRRYQARTAANQLSADLGSSLAARNLNNSGLGAGIVAGNRGRLMASAEQDIGKFQADVYERIAQAEYNAEHAENEHIRRGWLDLGRQIAYTAAEIGVNYKDKRAKEDAERTNAQAQAAGHMYLENIAGSNQDARYLNLSGIPERVTGQDLPPTTPGQVSPTDGSGSSPGVDIDPVRIESPYGIPDPDRMPIGDIDPRTGAAGGELALPSGRIESPSVKELKELFDDDARTMLGVMLPDYEKDIAEMDDLLKEEGEIGSGINVTASPDKIIRDEEIWKYGIIGPPGHGPPVREEPFELPETVVTAPRSTEAPPPDPLTTVSPEEQRNMLDETQIRGRMNPPSASTAEEPFEMDEMGVTAPREDVYRAITDTFGISDDVVPPESYMGLPAYYPLILETEGGYNRADPSKAGVWQVSYDEFLNAVENRSEYPKDIKNLSDSDIRDFYLWYHDGTVAEVNSEYTPELVKELFHSNPVFQYLYSDAAVHHGHAGAAQIASQFAVLHADDENPITTISKFDAERKSYMRVLQKNQIARVNRSYNQGNISSRERDVKVNAINRKWMSLTRRSTKTASRAKRILAIGRG